MNPIPYLKAFAWISIVALCCSIFTSFWIPLGIGAVLAALLLRITLPRR